MMRSRFDRFHPLFTGDTQISNSSVNSFCSLDEDLPKTRTAVQLVPKSLVFKVTKGLDLAPPSLKLEHLQTDQCLLVASKSEDHCPIGLAPLTFSRNQATTLIKSRSSPPKKASLLDRRKLNLTAAAETSGA